MEIVIVRLPKQRCWMLAQRRIRWVNINTALGSSQIQNAN